MSILTNFLKLLKPEPNDYVDVEKHISENYDKIDNKIEELDGYINKKTTQTSTIAELQSRKNLKVGDIVEILGYYTAGDGATHKRKIAREDDGSGVQLANGLWANIIHNGEVNVSWFGITENYNLGLYQKLLLYLKNGMTLNFGAGKTYIIGSGTNPEYSYSGLDSNNNRVPTGNYEIGIDERIVFNSLKNITINLNGAILKSNKKNPAIYKNSILYFENCENFKISNGTIIGNIDNANTYVDKGLFNKSSNIRINECKNFIFENIHSSKSVMDGFDLANSENIIMLNCHASYNFRQGISNVSTKRNKVVGGVIEKTGAIKFTLPAFGIDCEGSTGEEGSSYEGILFRDNLKGGINLHMLSNGVTIKNCTFQEELSGVGVSASVTRGDNSGNGYISSNYFYNCSAEIVSGNNIFEKNIIKIDYDYSLQNNKRLNFYVDYQKETFNFSGNKKNIIRNNDFIFNISNFETAEKNGLEIPTKVPLTFSLKRCLFEKNYIKNLAGNWSLRIFEGVKFLNNTIISDMDYPLIGALFPVSVELDEFYGNYIDNKYSDTSGTDNIFKIKKTNIKGFSKTVSFQKEKALKKDVELLKVYLFRTNNNDFSNKFVFKFYFFGIASFTDHTGKWEYKLDYSLKNKLTAKNSLGKTNAHIQISDKILQDENGFFVLLKPVGDNFNIKNIELSLEAEDISDFSLSKISIEQVSSYPNTNFIPAITVANTVESLNTLYYAEKMKEEGVYNDYISYNDEKFAYKKQQKEIEKQRMLSYQEALKENPNLTYGEFMPLQPMTLNLIEEPQPSEALRRFMDKYL